MRFVKGQLTRSILLLAENLAGFFPVEMLPTCNYKSVLSCVFLAVSTRVKVVESEANSFYIHALYMLQRYDRWGN